eukprot:PLAT7209.1.p1 GENE.PLAT7209.1~~PLAT7209.1.p1  ORF type:complete len:127 (+),score=32.10 PLAT7209.1:49-381(+)
MPSAPLRSSSPVLPSPKDLPEPPSWFLPTTSAAPAGGKAVAWHSSSRDSALTSSLDELPTAASPAAPPAAFPASSSPPAVDTSLDAILRRFQSSQALLTEARATTAAWES